MNKNIYTSVPQSLKDEQFETLIHSPAVKIERIISDGQATAAGEWYDQQWNEWVILLKGSAGIRFEDENDTITLNAGDYLFIKARRRHRVEWTSTEEKCIWLAVHFRPQL